MTEKLKTGTLSKFVPANRIAPNETSRFVASHLGLFCLPMSHKKDARLLMVKEVV